MRRLAWLMTIIALCAFAAAVPAAAQEAPTNLLRDPGMESQPYTPRTRDDLNIPSEWAVWYTELPRLNPWMNLPPVAFPHNGPDPAPYRGARALNLNKNFATFTAAVYQQVTVPLGAPISASAFAFVRTCDIPTGFDTCRTLETEQSGAYTRIGIDPNGGTNPTEPDIIWSTNLRPYEAWGQMSVSTLATGETVTLYLYTSQAFPRGINQVYWDEAFLAAGEPGSDPQALPTVGLEVGFVEPQGSRDDGSILHVVQAGDTIDSIAVAYRLTREQLLGLNPDLPSARFLQIGQQIIIRTPEPTLPPTETPTPTHTPTHTPVPPTATFTATPTHTPVPPTATTPPSATPVPPTATTPPSATPVPPTATTPPSATPVPPTIAPTSIPATTAPTSAPAVDAAAGGLPTTDPGIALAVLATDLPTDAPVQLPTVELPTVQLPTDAPPVVTEVAPTPVPPTAEPTSGDTPPVIAAADGVFFPFDPLDETASICLMMFQDDNANGLQDAGEELLPQGRITLALDGTIVAEHITGDLDPTCLDDLASARYVVEASAPDGFGLTTSPRLTVTTTGGAQITLAFGAAPGRVVPTFPPPDATPQRLAAASDDDDDSSGRRIGLFVLIGAAVVLVGGFIVALLVRALNR